MRNLTKIKPIKTIFMYERNLTKIKPIKDDTYVCIFSVTGEPPLCLAFTVVMALRQAVASARGDAGVTGWFQMGTFVSVC